MKQKKKLSRREKALRRLLLFLPLALLFVLSGVYHLTPGGALRDTERRVDCGRTRVIQSLGRADMRFGGLNRMYFYGNEQALLFTTVKFFPQTGWLAAPVTVVDCSKEAPLYVGLYCVRSQWWDELTEHYDSDEDFDAALRASFHDDDLYLIFGRVESQEAVSVRLQVVLTTEKDRRVVFETEVPRSKWFWKEDRLYFAEEFFHSEEWFADTSPYGNDFSITFQASLLDREGEALYETEVNGHVALFMEDDQWWWED